MEYSTLSTRLATFKPPSKRSKAGWPHKQPSAEAVALAGFYYRPEATGSDNVTCFVCQRSMDGWEEDDDPVEEHLKNSPDCGWAIHMAIQNKIKSEEAAEIQDPTSASIAEARRSTFAIGWPHESKRGWTCKTDKMVEAGWYFAPTDECEDWVSCAYCGLSLDGWEPKDNPFTEHYRRAPECVFFTYAGTTPPSKRPKAKKGRASKASRTSKASTRLSTQSNISTVSIQSDGQTMTEIPDLDESIDGSNTSVMSTMSTVSTATNKGKRKASAPRPKSSKSKKPKTTRQTRAKKTTQPEELTQIQQVEPELDIPQTSQPEPIQTEHTERPPVSSPLILEPTVTYPAIPQSAPELPMSLPPSPSPRPRQSRSEQVPTTHHSPIPPPPRSPSPQSTSDIENAPPSTRSPESRPPLSNTSPSNASDPLWTPVNIEMVFRLSPVASRGTAADTLAAESLFMIDDGLGEGEMEMTVQQWIEHVAAKAEADLKSEGERVVGIFEREGQRAMVALEGVECTA